ncbi:MAG: regulatory protein GemA, partial [Ruminococcus flavefaciens]|nr:regulatory protein GemA [Ruminococcus flavefaciens]
YIIPRLNLFCLIYYRRSKNGSKEDPFHQLVYGLTGKEHVSELNPSEARTVQAELQERMRLKNHNKPLKKKKSAKEDVPGMMTAAQQGLAWRLVYRLDELEPTAASVPERLIGAIEKILGIIASRTDPFRWVDFDDGTKLIEHLKRYVRSAERRAAKKAGDG